MINYFSGNKKVQKSFIQFYELYCIIYWASSGKWYFYNVYADGLCDLILHKYYSMHSQRKKIFTEKHSFQRKEKYNFQEKKMRKVYRKVA